MNKSECDRYAEFLAAATIHITRFATDRYLDRMAEEVADMADSLMDEYYKRFNANGTRKPESTQISFKGWK